MSCIHGRPRGRCRIGKQQRLEAGYGVPEDHIDQEDDDDE